MADRLAWGIIGAGHIAKALARGLEHSRTGRLLAVGSRTIEKANAFGDEFKVPKRYGSYEELLADPEVQAVYVATPHPMHTEWAVKAAEAKKNILCEKPIGINFAEAMSIIEAAERNNVFLMEAFMYRCHPQTKKLIELLKEKAIGQVRVIQATFSFGAGYNLESRLLNNALGGGGILDVGCYPVSMSRLIAGIANGKDFIEPLEVKGCGYLGAESRVDEYAVAVAKFPGNIIAQFATGVQVTQDNSVRIYGSEGNIVIPWPWIPARESGQVKMTLTKGKETKEIVVDCAEWLYGIEADVVGDTVMQGKKQASSPAMTWEDTFGNMKTLDMWRESIGLVYDAEKPENVTYTTSRRPLTVKPNNMKYGEIAGVDKKISRLVMGVDHPKTVPYAAVLFDDFIERGGNCFDTAYIYGGGIAEKVLGHYIKNRGIRKDVVILDKGSHTPFCTPEFLTKQFKESLERLQVDHVEIYMMHRDNPDVPVKEFIDVLNEHVKAGRMKVFGGSNWSKERVDAANRYAKRKGLQGFSAVSNNFSLARMVDAVWGGCIASSSPEYRAWHKKKQMPLMPWSSQARGFFVEGKAAPDKTDDKELTRCWYSEDNFKRLERAKELAKKKGCLPINIALAYVLCQPFPTFALIGPRMLSETRTSVPALDVELTPKELKWLNLEI